MSFADKTPIQGSLFQEFLGELPVEEAFDLIHGPDLIDRYQMRDYTGRPNMVNTAWVLKALVYVRRLPNTHHPPTVMLNNHGWEITVPNLAPVGIQEHMIAHQLGHLMIMKHDVKEYKTLYPIGAIFAESNFGVEALSDYIAEQLLTD